MIRALAAVLLLSICPALAAIAQEGDAPLPGLDDDRDITEMHIKVRVKVDGLIEHADTIKVECILFSAGDTVAVGTGQLWLYRESAPVTGASRAAESFEGSSIDKLVSVPIVAIEPYGQSFNYWRSGKCDLQIGLDGADVNPGSFETPRLCDTVNYQPDGQLACVWPDTDPVAAEFTFRRPGIPETDSAIDDAN